MSEDEEKSSPHSHNETPPLKDADENAKQELDSSEEGAPIPLTRGQKVKRHFRRFWYYYLGLLIFSIIFLPVFFLVVIPAVAQLVINKSDLVLVDAMVAQPKETSVILTIQAKIDLKVILPVRIEPVTLSLFDRAYGFDDAYAGAYIPGQTVKGNYTLGIKDQFTKIQNMTAWETFVKEVVFQEDSTLSVHGATNGYLGVLKCPVTINKDITSPGLNQFKGFSISNGALVKAEPDGTNLIGNVTLPNPTVITLDVGTLVLDIKSGDLIIGNATVTNVRLVPGSNTFPLRGVLSIDTVLKNLGDVLQTQGDALKAGNLSLNAVTRSIVWNGTYVPYYTDVLRQLTLTAKIGIGDFLKNTIHHMDLGSLLDGNRTTSTQALIHAAESKDSGLADLAASMKQNIHVRDVLQKEHPDRGDEVIDSLVRVLDTP